MIQAQGLVKDYGRRRVVDHLDLEVSAGEVVGLLGPNGAGKSTLIKQIAGEIKSDSGNIRFAGRDIGDLDAVERSRMGLARTFQVSSLMPEFSVLQNVVLAQQSVSGKIFRFFKPVLSDVSLLEPAMAQLERVGLADRAQMRPEGAKRLTGFLDGLRAEAPILLVEHDMDAGFALADRISVLVYGRVIATGTVDDIRGNEDVKRAYLGEEA